MTTTEGILCPKCRKELPDDANVCGYCGHRLEQLPTSAPSPRTASLSPAATVGALLVMFGSTLPWFGGFGNLLTGWDVALRHLFSAEPAVAATFPVIGFGLFVVAVPALWLAVAGKAPWWRRALGLSCLLIVAWFLLWRMVGYGESIGSAVKAGQVVVTFGALLLLATPSVPR